LTPFSADPASMRLISGFCHAFLLIPHSFTLRNYPLGLLNATAGRWNSNIFSA